MDSTALLPEPQLDGFGLHIGIVVARYNQHITAAMLQLALEELQRLRVSSEQIAIITTPGSYELASAAQAMLRGDAFDALICFGCVMKGETRHDVLVGDAAAQGLQRLALETHVPIIFGVLCAENQQQAQARIPRALECARAAVEMARTVRLLSAGQEYAAGRHSL